MLHNLLIYRFAILNILAVALAGAAYDLGYVHYIYSNDPTGITVIITILFAVTWAFTLRRVVSTSAGLNNLKLLKRLRYQGSAHAGQFMTTDREKDFEKVAWMSSMSNWLTVLGLIGTIIGFSIALSGVDRGALGQASGALDATETLIVGMRVVLNTTILGAILGFMNDINQRMLKTAMICLWCDRMDAVNESDGRERLQGSDK